MCEIDYTYAPDKSYEDDTATFFTDPKLYLEALQYVRRLQRGDMLHLPKLFNSPVIVDAVSGGFIEVVFLEKHNVNGTDYYFLNHSAITVSIVMSELRGAVLLDGQHPDYDKCLEIAEKVWNRALGEE